MEILRGSKLKVKIDLRTLIKKILTINGQWRAIIGWEKMNKKTN